MHFILLGKDPRITKTRPISPGLAEQEPPKNASRDLQVSHATAHQRACVYNQKDTADIWPSCQQEAFADQKEHKRKTNIFSLWASHMWSEKTNTGPLDMFGTVFQRNTIY